MTKNIIHYVKLTRPPNNFITALSVFIGATVSGDIETGERILLACISAWFISAGGNTINDFFDVNIDKINKPGRPLPRGSISPKSALAFSIFLFSMGFFLSFWIKPFSPFIASLACGLLIAYSYALKKTMLWGNLTVSVVSALAFIYGGIATEDFRLSMIPAAFALLFHLGREILKDIEDIKGDSSVGASTLPLKLGVKFSLDICTLVFLFLMVLTTLPYFLHIFSFIYLLAAVLGVDTVLVYVIRSMRHDHSSKNLHRLSNILKIDMIVGLVAIFLGRI